MQRPPAYVDGAAAEALGDQLAAALARREAETPWVLGTTSLALARETCLPMPEPAPVTIAIMIRLFQVSVDKEGTDVLQRAGSFR